MQSKESAFRPIDTQVGFPTEERKVKTLWDDKEIFKRSIDEKPDEKRYVFYDGPPFATGLPHYGHLVANTIKDIVPRYWAMRGFKIERRFGWDTHGLPIEMLMEKELELSGPTSIRAFGVDRFNEACRANVLKYTEEWRRVVGRLGRWVDFDNDYKTMDATFMESVWWVFKSLWDKGLVYEDFRVMPFSWRLSTALSNFEANLDYRDVQDPAITVSMPISNQPGVSLLIWTTTPWTLPSNLAIAVGSDIDYVKAKTPDDDEVYIVAKERFKSVLGEDATVIEVVKGSELVGIRYEPIFDFFADHANSFQVIASGHVTTDNGTGLVHMAPDFGEDDFAACKAAGIHVIQSVDNEGCFAENVPPYAGQNVKAADPTIIKDIKHSGRLFKQATIQHSYPYCWRSGTPLIYKAVPARFVRVQALRERMVKHNQDIHWVPGAVGSKRFGNWLADARDWNVSRNRFWGTPIPVWRCTNCDQEDCLGSIEELEAATGAKIDDIHPHKIDGLTYKCSQCEGEMVRINDVFDCWFESGSMPYAQDHYPFENTARFEANFPAEFIAEGLDQTRGWFYTLLVLSTALFDRPPFTNCIVNGMVLAEDGSKMSKSKQNYPNPESVFEQYGADALRAYLINSPVVRAEPLRFSENGVRDVVRTVLIPLRNAWSFFVQYANIDGWHPETGLPGVETPKVEDRPELDRWLLSVQQSLVRDVNEQMEGYYLYKVVPPILGFIDDLTNWYIRRSRRRFWRAADDVSGQVDKACAYATLYEALVTFAKVMAPVLPFVSESVYQNLVVEPDTSSAQDSVHLCAYPQVESQKIDDALEREVEQVRKVVSMGRALREKHRLKTRQPLRRVTVVHHDAAVRDAVASQRDLIAEELNVKDVAVVQNDSDLATLSFKANFKTLGRRLGKRMKDAAQTIANFSSEQWAELQDGGHITVADEHITAEDIIVVRTARGDVVIEVEGSLTVAIDHILDDELIAEGHAREITSRLQRLRKDRGLDVTDRIALRASTSSDVLTTVLDQYKSSIAAEVLATSFDVTQDDNLETIVELDGHILRIDMQRA
ncbi:MAG: isoleucine--tRNA ligase [Myxococcota bacterium]|nr:isoleucine--tRNA ligase [Myxococcota bacterium]